MSAEADGEEARKLVANERAKLTATFLNNLAVALFAVGALTPLSGAFQAAVAPSLGGAAAAGVCFLASGALHLLARRFLRRLRP